MKALMHYVSIIIASIMKIVTVNENTNTTIVKGDVETGVIEVIIHECIE
jgi:hypothetical protein